MKLAKSVWTVDEFFGPAPPSTPSPSFFQAVEKNVGVHANHDFCCLEVLFGRVEKNKMLTSILRHSLSGYTDIVLCGLRVDSEVSHQYFFFLKICVILLQQLFDNICHLLPNYTFNVFNWESHHGHNEYFIT